jgi:hypothetical protein
VWLNFQKSQEEVDTKIREVFCIAERGLTLTFMKTRVKTKNGNTFNEKAVFFKRMGTTVNEDKLRNILARKGKSKQSILTPKTN